MWALVFYLHLFPSGGYVQESCYEDIAWEKRISSCFTATPQIKGRGKRKLGCVCVWFYILWDSWIKTVMAGFLG